MTGQIWHSYDFSTHVFFASHYQRDWWSLWEPRWFAGFDVASYPPLTHQLSALLGWLIGIETAVNVLTMGCILVFPLAVSILIRQCVGSKAATRGAALAVVTPSVLLAGYAFGQLPTLFALDASLLAAAALVTYLRHGGWPRLALVLALDGVVVSAHHATMLFFLGPLFGTVALAEMLRPAPRRIILARRGILAALGTGCTGALVILPFWVWHATEYVNQLPIDHQSRHDFLRDPIAQDLFFWAEHGVLVAALILAPILLRRQARRMLPWYSFALVFLVLGLGGTTPLPRLLFGAQWAWLTYDRFSIWADVPLLVLLATIARVWLDGDQFDERATSGTPRPSRGSRGLRAAWALTLVWLGVFGIADALLPALVQSEPVPIDPRPIVAFLAGHDRDPRGQPGWRYLTLGFGEQAGLVHARTDAGTVDGYYYTARRLPLLTRSGIASLDFSLLWDPRARALRALLADPGPLGLRWIFTRDPAYEKILAASGWEDGEILANGVEVWEAPGPVSPLAPPRTKGGFLAIWWGIVPLVTLVASGVLGWWTWCRRGAGDEGDRLNRPSGFASF